MEIQLTMLMNGLLVMAVKTINYYGWPSPSSGRILCGAISSTAGSQAPAEMKVMIIVNGNEAGNDYIITKPTGLFSKHFTFNTPLEINAGDGINFRSKTSNASVNIQLSL